jgi:recombinational DNA repair protein (RecF pathway)
MSRVRLSYFLKLHAELATIRRVDLLVSSFPLASDLRTSAAAAVVAELLISYCPPNEPAPRRFRLGVAALDALLAGTDTDRVVAYVEFWVLHLAGLMPAPAELDGKPTADELGFMIGCRGLSLAELDLPVPEPAARRLDTMVRAEAERPLRALAFYRSHPG